MKWLSTLAIGLAVLTAAADSGWAKGAAPRSGYSYLLPNWQETRDHPAPLATVRENREGFTQIDFRWPAAPNGVNSRLQQQAWEDGESYVVFDRRGKRIFCTCEGDATPVVVFRRTADRDIYYFVDYDGRPPPSMKYGDVPYEYTFFALSARGMHYYACDFSPRLRAVASPALLRKPVSPYGNEIPGRIAAYLSVHGADMARDRCKEIDFKK